jgi:hypothetical protein
MPFPGHRNSSPSLCNRIPLLSLIVLAVFAMGATPAMAVHSIELSTDTQVATAGYFQLSWHGDVQQAQYRLLESGSPRFNHSTVIYEGPDLATVMSGKTNGTYYYRVAELEGDTPVTVSNTVKVQVAHHSLARAFLFFAIGAAVFLATLLMILRGNRQTHNRDL